MTLENRVADWVRTRIGDDHMQPRERAMRLLEEAIELAQAEGITFDQARRQLGYVYNRPTGEPSQEAAGVAVCLLGWCAATGNRLLDLAEREIRRIELKPVEEIRGSVTRKNDFDLVTCVQPPAEVDMPHLEPGGVCPDNANGFHAYTRTNPDRCYFCGVTREKRGLS